MKPWMKIAVYGALAAVILDHIAAPTLKKSVGL